MAAEQSIPAQTKMGSPRPKITVRTHTRVMALIAAIRAHAETKTSAGQHQDEDYSIALRSIREHLGDVSMLDDLLTARRKASAEEDNL